MLFRELVPAAIRRHSLRGAITFAGLLLLSLALAGCGTGVSASNMFAQPTAAAVAQAQPTTAAVGQVQPSDTSTQGQAVPEATVTITWQNAGDVTVTPVPAQAGAAQGSQSGNTSADNSTPVPAASGSAASTNNNAEATPTAGGGYQAVSFAGTCDNLPETANRQGDWQVSGRTVHVDGSTNIDQRQGQLHAGARVAIQGWQRPDGTVDAGWVIVLPDNNAGGNESTPGASSAPAATATPVPQDQSAPAGEVTPVPNAAQAQGASGLSGALGHPVEFRGFVQHLPGSGLVGPWVVSDRTVNVNSRTRIQQQFGPVSMGAYVQVMGWTQPDGSVNAAWVQTKKANPGRGNGKVPPGQAKKGANGNNQNQGSQGEDNQNQGSQGEDNQNQGDQSNQNDQANGNAAFPVEWQGVCQQMPQGTLVGTWTVDGEQVVVANTTRVENAGAGLRPGAYLDITGWPQSDGTFYATRIRLAPGWPAANYLGNPGPGNGANGPARNAGEGNQGNGKGNGNGRGKGNGNGKGKGD